MSYQSEGVMDLDNQIYPMLAKIDWFSKCGTELAQAIPIQSERAPDRLAAISSALGHKWEDACTQAQGDLTEFLADRDYDAYDHWNDLAHASRKRLEGEVMPQVNSALERIDAGVLSDSVRLDLNRFALYSAYNRQFKRAPNFFYQLSLVYQAGHLPCGWNGDLDEWPTGRLLVY